MASAGGNLAEDPPTLAYRIEAGERGPVVRWEDEPVEITAEAALAAAVHPGRGDSAEVQDWLREALADGPVPAAEVHKLAKDAGFSPSQVNKAKARIGVRSRKDGFGPRAPWAWSLTDR